MVVVALEVVHELLSEVLFNFLVESVSFAEVLGHFFWVIASFDTYPPSPIRR